MGEIYFRVPPISRTKIQGLSGTFSKPSPAMFYHMMLEYRVSGIMSKKSELMLMRHVTASVQSNLGAIQS